jgi:DNA topoisomerase-2
MKTIKTSNGFRNIFDEIIVNAADNVVRGIAQKIKQKYIRITVDVENLTIRVENDGPYIAVSIHEKSGLYNTTLIFGRSLTGSNFNDEEERTAGGKNGYGGKLCNIMSRWFEVENVDAKRHLRLVQKWKNNMDPEKEGEPKVTKDSSKGYTAVTYKPDLKRFGMEKKFDEDTVNLLRRRSLELAATLGVDIEVSFNGERLLSPDAAAKPRPSSMKMYAKMVFGDTAFVGKKMNARWEVYVGASTDDEFVNHSFVNHIRTSQGGTHVEHIKAQIIDGIIDATNKRKGVTPAARRSLRVDIGRLLHIVVSAMIVNPGFDTQSKERLTTRPSDFNGASAPRGENPCEIDENFIKKIIKETDIPSLMEVAADRRKVTELRKTDGRKGKNGRVIVEKLEDATKAGGAEGHKCKLILTEGDSAKALAMSGMSVVGREYYGVFPLKGKLLNVRDASHGQIIGNDEISNLKKILGLEAGKTYTSTKELRYGTVVVMTDADQVKTTPLPRGETTTVL